MIKASASMNINFPKIIHKEDLKNIANQIFIPTMQRNIHNQVALNEEPLRPNDPKYTERKKRKGLSPKILIATGELLGSFIVRDRGASAVLITLKGGRKKIGEFLQFYHGKNFFGISSVMESNAVAYMKKRIKEILKNGRS